MHLQQVAHPVAGVGRALVPDLAAEDHHVSRLAENPLRRGPLVLGVPVRRPAGAVTAGHEGGRAELLAEVVEVVVCGGDVHRDAQAGIGHQVFGNRQGLPVGVQALRGPPGAGQPRRHADAVAVGTVQGLGQLDDPGAVEKTGEQRVAVEDVVDGLAEKAVPLRGPGAVEALRDRIQGVHGRAQPLDFSGLEDPGQVGVAVAVYGFGLLLQLPVCHQRNRFDQSPSPPFLARICSVCQGLLSP